VKYIAGKNKQGRTKTNRGTVLLFDNYFEMKKSRKIPIVKQKNRQTVWKVSSWAKRRISNGLKTRFFAMLRMTKSGKSAFSHSLLSPCLSKQL